MWTVKIPTVVNAAIHLNFARFVTMVFNLKILYALPVHQAARNASANVSSANLDSDWKMVRAKNVKPHRTVLLVTSWETV